MAIVKYRGWGPVWRNRFFDDDSWDKLMDWPSISDNSGGLDIYETDDAVVVEAQVPGIKEENVDVTIEGNVITIHAEENEVEEEKEKKKTIYKATRQTQFSYSTNLPRMVDYTKAEAEVQNGVVKVTIPKAEEEKPKKVKVTKK